MTRSTTASRGPRVRPRRGGDRVGRRDCERRGGVLLPLSPESSPLLVRPREDMICLKAYDHPGTRKALIPIVSVLPVFLTAGERAITISKTNTAQKLREHLELTVFGAALKDTAFLGFSSFYSQDYKELKLSGGQPHISLFHNRSLPGHVRAILATPSYAHGDHNHSARAHAIWKQKHAKLTN